MDKAPDKALKTKIEAYKESTSLSKWEKDVLSRECRRLEKKLDLKKVEPKQYLFLKQISEHLKLGETMNLPELAKSAGYSRIKAKNPGTMILKDIDGKLFSEIVGFSPKDVEFELIKVLKQDSDLSAKMRALELASKITGMQEDKGTQIQINTLGIELSD